MSNNVNINNLFENCNNSKKILKIDFILNNYNKFSLSFSEKNGFLTKNIEIDFSNKNYIMAPSWDFIDSLEFKHTTNDIYNNIIFSDIFIYQSNNFINKINITNNCNVNIIHLRLEQDAIDFWSEPNKMTRDNFKIKLSEKYINLITKLINKNDKSIILTYNTDNIVINYLKNNNYNYYVDEKTKNNNRELNAIIDMYNSKHCNNIFIAVGGSTFSWTIAKIIKPKHIEWIDINNI